MNSTLAGFAAPYVDESSVLQQTIPMYSRIKGARVAGSLSHQPIVAYRGLPVMEFSVLRAFPLPEHSLLPP